MASCQEQKGSSNNVKLNAPIEENTDSIEIDFPFQQIISNSRTRKARYEIDYGVGTNLKAVPKDILTKYLTPFPIRNIKDFSIEYDEYSRYYFFDYVEFDDFILFTIIHDDEVGYDNYYSYTYDKKKGVIRDVVLIAMVGADGGHGQTEALTYSTSKKNLTVKSDSEYDEDLFEEGYENCYTREKTQFETTYKFELLNTQITKRQIKQSIDTICSTK
ncbi:MAG: hypothetical protein ACJAV5_002221 [Vicingaceae bacterium]